MLFRPKPSNSVSIFAVGVTATLTFVSCTGEKFAACESCADASAGTAGAGGTAGSAATGGSSGSLGTSGTGGTGGTRGGTGGSGESGGGGSPTGGSSGSAGSGATDAGDRFPRTPLLDDFNRPDGQLAATWIGNRSSFAIVDQALTYAAGACSPVLWQSAFGAEQEVFATLSAVNNQAAEMNLVLKAQEVVECELIEILYSPARRRVEVHYCHEGAWEELDGIAATLEAGDRLGGRYLSDGHVHVYVNGVRAAIFDVSAYPHKAAGGRIGVNCVGPADGSMAWDDFGGG
jgi:hypothetical protein